MFIIFTVEYKNDFGFYNKFSYIKFGLFYNIEFDYLNYHLAL